MSKYQYIGPVMYFKAVSSNSWKAETWADSEKQAVSNFKYQYKVYAKMSPNAGGIKLMGVISIIQ